ncbi:hypothetical protein TVAG_274580 [Trichomonas vaginalis G3]|uniref:Uncharacterized protein n=1 Tax=Trichomonas vaginalis (strain ATCC PRA-98 / G3) TaxID=412133 RepID=A2EB49_TRIV3|nr:protein ubiquitination [Trichomonas vaginalis G3]EAY10095.1 hypothetical protein TVAG_274580 [Trichomonas vaginalis G3]KAI5531530.1 protein ubiquitination [Trichomonas vaginalis G3]|eukprot:XP_001322318.1 hypothetical protein [Trichomonas vaginalis G3]
MIEVSLGSHYLASSALYKHDNAFSFIINGKEFATTKHHAICLSNKVKDLFFQDNTINNLSIIVEHVSEEVCEIFNALILKGLYSGEISINESQELFFIGREIENYELVKQYSYYFDKIEMSLSNFNEFLDYSKLINDYSKCIKFICTNFDIIDTNTLINILDNLGYDLIEQIMTNDEFILMSENKIVEVIIGLCEKSSKYKRLLKYIQLQFCTVEGVQTVFDYYDKTVCCEECKLFMDCFRKRLLTETKFGCTKRIQILDDDLKLKVEKLFSMPKSPKLFDEIYQTLRSLINNDKLLQYAIISGYNDVRAENNGATVLMRSAIINDFEFFKKLHELGGDIQVLDDYNHNALHWFVHNGNLEAVQYCIQYLDVNAQNKYLETPLHSACQYNRTEIVKILCSLPNIKFNLKNNRNVTPLENTKSPEIYNILVAHGAQK